MGKLSWGIGLKIMEPRKDNAQGSAETRTADPERAKKIRKCFDYMSSLKAVLTKDEYAQYLLYLKLLKENYMKEKILFYATVAFQIFFPSDMKAVLDNYDIRKQLYSQSKYFFPKSDREAYSFECGELLKELEEKVRKYNEHQEKRLLRLLQKGERKCVKLQTPVYIEYDKAKLR